MEDRGLFPIFRRKKKKGQPEFECEVLLKVV